LITDVRGYTRFTQTRGDEAAGALAARFAAVTREVVTAAQGVLLELRGDEALVVFSSARRAIRAAVALQDRFVEETLADPSVPLTVGIGLDAGEAVEVEGGYRGGALNLAARLCSAARPGQVLASAEIVHLARAVTGVRYQSRGRMRFKGLAEPVMVMEVLPAVEDPVRARRFAEVVKVAQPAVPQRRRRTWVAAAAMLAVLAAAVVVALVAQGGTPVAVVADSVAVVGAMGLKVMASVPVGSRPDGIAAGFGSVWAVNEAAGSVSRLDASTRRTVQTIGVGRSPRGVAVGPTGVWVANSADRSVSWINPRTNTVVKTIPVGNAPTGVAAGRGNVWVTNSLDDTISVIDATSGQVTATIPVGRRPTGIAIGATDAWVTNSGDGTVSRIDTSTRVVTDTVTVGAGPDGVAVGAGGVWVTNTLDDTVTHINPSASRVAATIPAGKGPDGVAVTSAGVWVTTEYGGTLSRIDPASDQVVRSLALGGGPRAIVSVRDALWVTAAGSPTAHRGGTLRVLLNDGAIQTIDPQADYTFADSMASTETNDGLVTYRRVDGPDGGTLVPDLATALPKPTDGGKTYTFHVRTGIRYSTGAPVRPSDIRRGLEDLQDPGRLCGGGEELLRRNPRGGWVHQGAHQLPAVPRCGGRRRGGNRHHPPGRARRGLPEQARSAGGRRSPAGHPRP
jgi:YVTN family beta-propeller protein